MTEAAKDPELYSPNGYHFEPVNHKLDYVQNPMSYALVHKDEPYYEQVLEVIRKGEEGKAQKEMEERLCPVSSKLNSVLRNIVAFDVPFDLAAPHVCVNSELFNYIFGDSTHNYIRIGGGGRSINVHIHKDAELAGYYSIKITG